MAREPRSIDLDGTGRNGKSKDTRFYVVKVRCGNCGHAGECKIPKGLAVDGYPCPHCHTLRMTPDLRPKDN